MRGERAEPRRGPRRRGRAGRRGVRGHDQHDDRRHGGGAGLRGALAAVARGTDGRGEQVQEERGDLRGRQGPLRRAQQGRAHSQAEGRSRVMSSLPHRKGTLNSTSYSSKCTSNLLCVSLINQRVSNRAGAALGSWRDASVDAARARCERPSFASPHPSAPSSPASCRTSPRRPQPRPPRPPRRPASPRLHRRARLA